jgi:hypothetical protein
VVSSLCFAVDGEMLSYLCKGMNRGRLMPMSDEARAALATLRKIELEGDPTSWAITHRDEIAKAFDKLLTFMSEAERLQAENAALRQRLDNLASDIDRFYVDD